jgi:hypothetical protein
MTFQANPIPIVVKSLGMCKRSFKIGVLVNMIFVTATYFPLMRMLVPNIANQICSANSAYNHSKTQPPASLAPPTNYHGQPHLPIPSPYLRLKHDNSHVPTESYLWPPSYYQSTHTPNLHHKFPQKLQSTNLKRQHQDTIEFAITCSIITKATSPKYGPSIPQDFQTPRNLEPIR